MRLVSNAAEIKTTLEQTIANSAHIEYLSENEPVHLHVVTGMDQCVVRFTTDIPYLSNWGTALLLGPGSIFNAHTAHEFVPKAELQGAVELYITLTRSLLADESRVEHSVSKGAIR